MSRNIKVLPVLPSKNLIVDRPTIRSLINFELIFVCDVRECSNIILSHVAVQFSLPHLLKKVFSPLYTLAFFVTD